MMRTLIFLVIAMTALGCAPEAVVEQGGAAPDNTQLFGKGDTPFEAPLGLEGEIDWAAIAQRCGPPREDEPVVYADDFKWGYGHEEMGARFEEMYASGKRLEGRAYYEEASGRFVMPLTEAWGRQTYASKRLIERPGRRNHRVLVEGEPSRALVFPRGCENLLPMPPILSGLRASLNPGAVQLRTI